MSDSYGVRQDRLPSMVAPDYIVAKTVGQVNETIEYFFSVRAYGFSINWKVHTPFFAFSNRYFLYKICLIITRGGFQDRMIKSRLYFRFCTNMNIEKCDFGQRNDCIHQRSNAPFKNRNRHRRRDLPLGRDKPHGRLWRRQPGQQVAGHKAAPCRGGRDCHRNHPRAATFRTVKLKKQISKITYGNGNTAVIIGFLSQAYRSFRRIIKSLFPDFKPRRLQPNRIMAAGTLFSQNTGCTAKASEWQPYRQKNERR